MLARIVKNSMILHGSLSICLTILWWACLLLPRPVIRMAIRPSAINIQKLLSVGIVKHSALTAKTSVSTSLCSLMEFSEIAECGSTDSIVEVKKAVICRNITILPII